MKIKFWIILIGILVGGISYWFNSSDDLTLFGVSIYLIMSIGAFSGSAMLLYFSEEKPVRISMFLTLGAELAIFARIIFDLNFTETTHNLFPFEIIITSVCIIVSALAGTYISLLLRNLLNKKLHKGL